jgi:hypothetical protein
LGLANENRVACIPELVSTYDISPDKRRVVGCGKYGDTNERVVADGISPSLFRAVLAPPPGDDVPTPSAFNCCKKPIAPERLAALRLALLAVVADATLGGWERKYVIIILTQQKEAHNNANSPAFERARFASLDLFGWRE